MDKGAFERVAKRIDGYKDEMIELQKKLIPTRAIGPASGGDGELEKCKILEPIIREIYDEVQIIKAPDDRVSCGYRPNIVAKTKGKSSDRTIWIMGHMDVVPAGDESAWKTPPFEAVVKDGNIYGRGSEDNHQGIISALFSAKALKEEGITPSYNLGGLYVSDEETGSEYGAIYVLKNHKDLFSTNDLVIVPDWGNSEGSVIETAEKSIVWLKIRVKGKQAHGAFPYKGNNAYRAAAHLICRMDDLYKKYPGEDPLFDPPISTFEPTMKEQNVPNINTIPGEDVTCFDCRIHPSVDLGEFIKVVEGYFKEIEDKFKVKVTYETPQRVQAPKPTSADSPIVGMLARAAKELFNVEAKPVGIGGGTVGACFREVNLDSVVYSRMQVTFHQPNEYCPVEFLIGDTKTWAHVLMQ